jgi:hypothetical protein
MLFFYSALDVVESVFVVGRQVLYLFGNLGSGSLHVIIDVYIE